jgi:hypothetical protein
MKVNPAVRAFGWLLIALFVATFAAVVWLTVAGSAHAAHGFRQQSRADITTK